MRLAIHHNEGSFSTRWMSYCDEHQIPYRVVNCADSDIVKQLSSTDGLLWHWNHQDPREQLLARHVIKSAEAMGVVVFPSTATCWHFDDKLAQKYLLEAIGAPLVPSYVAYSLADALQWIDRTDFPKVFKLRRGAGSTNVRLVHDARQARELARQAFAAGFQPVGGYGTDAARRYRAARRKGDLLAAVTRLPKTLAAIRQLNRALGREAGYVYFQDFVAGNKFDTRVTVIGNRAFAYTRNVRPNDFRASGGGDIVYDLDRIRPECVQIAFDVARKLGSQSVAFDFVLAEKGRPLIVEISYCYVASLVYQCAGHWKYPFEWSEGHMWPQDAILLDLFEEVRARTIPSQLAISAEPRTICGGP